LEHGEALKMIYDRPEIDMKELLEQQAAQGKPLIVIEPATSIDLVEALRSVIPEAKKHLVQCFNLSLVNDSAPK